MGWWLKQPATHVRGVNLYKKWSASTGELRDYPNALLSTCKKIHLVCSRKNTSKRTGSGLPIALLDTKETQCHAYHLLYWNVAGLGACQGPERSQSRVLLCTPQGSVWPSCGSHFSSQLLLPIVFDTDSRHGDLQHSHPRGAR